LDQRNFLKVVDTLEKFEAGMLDRKSVAARDFMNFKRQLYQMYEVQNRSVHEHELYSFTIERENLKWLYRANRDFLAEIEKMDTIEQMADHTALKGQVFKRKMMSPKKVRGLGAFASMVGIYSYMPYMAVYLGSTVPVVAMCASALYGMLSFSESRIINSISVIEEGDHKGKLQLNIGSSPFSSYNIIADIRDIQSAVSLHNDDIGEDDVESNIVLVHKHICGQTGAACGAPEAFSLPADAYRDKNYMDWLLSAKGGETTLIDDYQDLMNKNFLHQTKNSSINTIDLLKARAENNQMADQDNILEAQLHLNDPQVDKNLTLLAEKYGQDYLKSLSDKELYSLYKKNLAG
jgi:hypothetical protein